MYYVPILYTGEKTDSFNAAFIQMLENCGHVHHACNNNISYM